MTQFLTSAKAAACCGVSIDTIRALFDQGAISGKRSRAGYRLYDVDSVAAWDRHVTVSEAARQLAVSPDTVRAWYDSGTLWGYRTDSGHRRIAPAAIERAKAARP